MRVLSKSGSGSERSSLCPCTPPKSRSGPMMRSPVMRSPSGRLCSPAGATQPRIQASPSNNAQEEMSSTSRDTRRSLERSWSGPLASPVRGQPEQECPRPRISEPSPVPVVHSSTYLRSTQQPSASLLDPAYTPYVPEHGAKGAGVQVSKVHSQRSRPRSTDNALEWAMRRADLSLDELERNPLPLQKAFYELSRGPVGEMTNSAAQAAARLTLKAGKEVTRATIPVGKWALSEGLKAAGGLILAQHSKNDKNESKKDKAN